MSDREFVQSLYDLSDELALYRVPKFQEEHRELVGSVDDLRYSMRTVAATSDWIGYAFELSRELLTSDHTFPVLPPPEFELTRRTLEFAAKRGTPEMPLHEPKMDNVICPEIELRFERSLAWYESGAEPVRSHKAAAVLFDAAGEPFAYQKSSGLSTAFVWRGTHFDTAAGRRWLPAGSIVRPVYHEYAQGAGPQWTNTGVGLTGLRRPRLDDVVFVRFSTCLLPSDLRKPFLRLGVQQTEKLEDDLTPAVELDERTVASRVAALMKGKQFLLV